MKDTQNHGQAPEGTAETTTTPRRRNRAGSRGGETPLPPEIGGVNGPEPTRYGDWERNGRCTDF